MLKTLTTIVCVIMTCTVMNSQVYTGIQSQNRVDGTQKIKVNPQNDCIEYLEFSPNYLKSTQINPSFLKQKLGLPQAFEFKKSKESSDRNGDKHVKYQLYHHNIEVEGMVYSVHFKNNVPISANGKLTKEESLFQMPLLTEYQVVEKAISIFNAEKFIWDSDKSLYPEAHLMYVPTDSVLTLCYKVDVYAIMPLKREFVYINALNGEVVKRISRIHDTDQTGTATTQYNGVVEITTDENGGLYTLNEVSRGDGIHTYNMNNGINYSSASEFYDDDNNWDSSEDMTAYDAHYGSEKTYDYYYSKFGRNSIDDNGFALVSYVHYDTNYANAFWDGQRMTYGDGDGVTYNALTCMDIVAHEITHGLTSYTANLEYQYESGALNESFSDIFGVAVDFYAHPSTANYLMGEQIFVNGQGAIRSMENPNSMDDPDTYLGNYWESGSWDNGGVHTNSSVQNYWFYLLCEGGSGVNDNGVSYAINPIGMEAAEAIAYRNLTVYLTQYSDYSDARFYSIQAATDLYGDCSTEVIEVTNAWNAVGVGEVYSNAVRAWFEADQTYFCINPATVNFINQSTNASTYSWYVNDALQSTEESPTITFDQTGNYDIKLIVSGSAACNGNDTVEFSNFIEVSDIGAPTAPLKTPSSIYGGSGGIYQFTFGGIDHSSSGADDGYVDNACQTKADVQEGKEYSILVKTGSYYDEVVKVWIDLNNDGEFTNDSELIFIDESTGSIHYADIILPACANPDIPLRLRVGCDRVEYASSLTGQSNSYYGQYEDYTVEILNNAQSPEVNFSFSDTIVGIDEVVYFWDKTLNLPTQWDWTFEGGDPASSSIANPSASFATKGEFDIQLTATNVHGSSSITQKIYIINEFILGTDTGSTSSSGILFDSGGKDGNYANSERYTFLISPVCAKNIEITFNDFYTESCCDYLNIYDGTSNADQLITTLKGSLSTITQFTASSGNMFLEFYTDGSVTGSGFEAQWTSIDYGEGSAVVADFEDPVGNIPLNFDYQFKDRSLNDPMLWSWKFGNGVSSNEQDPVYKYMIAGDYNVQLAVDNCLSKDTIEKLVTVDVDPEISINSDTVVINVMSGDSISDYIEVDNLSGGILAFEGNLIATYQQSYFNSDIKIDAKAINGYQKTSANGYFIYAEVPEFDNSENPQQIGTKIESYQVTNDLSGVNVILSGDLRSNYSLTNLLIAQGARYETVSTTLTQEMLDTTHVVMVDDASDYILDTHKDLLQNWINNSGFLMVQGDQEYTLFNDVLEGSGISFVADDAYNGYGTIFPHEVTSGIDQYYINSGALASLDTDDNATVIINDSYDQCYSAVGSIGRGKVMAVSNEAFSGLSYTGHESLLLNSLKWGISLVNSEWIKVENGFRFVDAAQSDSVKYQILSEGLLEGTYIGDIQVSNNDQDNPSIDIPIKLNVTGIEKIEINIDSLWFPKVFVGESDSLQFTILNTGTTNLDVSSIISSVAEFEVVFSTTNIPPRGSAVVKIKFNPTINQIYNGELSISSSDPDTPILILPVKGNAVNPPVFEVSDEIVENLNTDETALRSLTISNVNGESALYVDSISIIDFTSTQSLLSDSTQFDLTDHSILTVNAYLSDFTTLMIKNGASVSTSYIDTTNMPDVLWLNRYSSYYLNDDIVNFLERWIKNGGGIYIDANNLNSSYKLYQLLQNIGVEIGYIGSYYGTYYISDHKVMNQVNQTVVTSTLYNEIISENDIPLIYNSNYNAYASVVNYGYGRVVVTTFSCLDYMDNTSKELFGMNSMRWLANKNSWLWVSDYPVDSIQAGEEVEMSLMFDAESRQEGTYQGRINISTNDPINPTATVLATLNVTGVPKQAFISDTIRFNEQFVDYEIFDSVMVYNPGTSNLEVTNVYSTNSDYSIEETSFTLTPRQTKWMAISYEPLAVETDNAYLIFENNTAEQVDTIVISGWAIEPPVLSVSPTELDLALRPGESISEEVVLDNTQGGSSLNYSLEIQYNDGLDRTLDLQSVLDSLNQSYYSITSLIPNKYSFSGGSSSRYISDGGGDMYDSGNYLGTNLASSIYYSDNQVALSSNFGSNGKYFTRKYDGLFVMGADIDNISMFSITGGLGADGYGTVDTTTLVTQLGGKMFKGFVKRVHGVSEPSVNHLIIVEQDEAIYQTCSSSTNYDDHFIYELNNSTRIYYLLYAGSQGTFIDDDSTLEIMKAFLKVAEGNSTWVVPNKLSGSVSAGGEESLNVLIDAGELAEGTYEANILYQNNDPENPELLTTINLDVRNNYAPKLVNPIGNKVIYLTYNGEIDLNEVFSDPDNDQLFYQVKSSDNSVVFPVLNNGSILKLTPLVGGVVTIDIEATDNNFAPVTDSFEVLVQANNSPIVIGQLQDISMGINDVTRVINLGSYFSDPDGDQLTYSSSVTTSGVVQSENGGDLLLISALGDGNTIVTVTASDGKGASASNSFIASVVGISTDIDDNLYEGGIYVYPNPVKSTLYIKTKAELLITEIMIVDINGRQVNIDSVYTQETLEVDVSQLDSGVYFMRINTNDGEVIKKILKQ